MIKGTGVLYLGDRVEVSDRYGRRGQGEVVELHRNYVVVSGSHVYGDSKAIFPYTSLKRIDAT